MQLLFAITSVKMTQSGKDKFNSFITRLMLVTEAMDSFNTNPNLAIKRLIDLEYIENTPISIAQFLKKNKKLDKKVICAYLNDNKMVAETYYKLFPEDTLIFN